MNNDNLSSAAAPLPSLFSSFSSSFVFSCEGVHPVLPTIVPGNVSGHSSIESMIPSLSESLHPFESTSRPSGVSKQESSESITPSLSISFSEIISQPSESTLVPDGVFSHKSKTPPELSKSFTPSPSESSGQPSILTGIFYSVF
jgi:hypothetical protein